MKWALVGAIFGPVGACSFTLLRPKKAGLIHLRIHAFELLIEIMNPLRVAQLPFSASHCCQKKRHVGFPAVYEPP
jgi:hypothetical protein